MVPPNAPMKSFSSLKYQVWRNWSSSRNCWTSKGMAMRIRCVGAREFILLICKTNAGSEGNHYIQPNRRKEKAISAPVYMYENWPCKHLLEMPLKCSGKVFMFAYNFLLNTICLRTSNNHLGQHRSLIFHTSSLSQRWNWIWLQWRVAQLFRCTAMLFTLHLMNLHGSSFGSAAVACFPACSDKSGFGLPGPPSLN